MSLRDKAREVRERGVQERGNFEPHGVPLKMYKYWLDNSSSKKRNRIFFKEERENFCHFWRVVMFWAPMVYVKQKFLDFMETSLGLASVALLLVSALIFAMATSETFLVAVGIIAAAAAAIAAVVGLLFLIDKFWPKSWRRNTEKAFLGLLAVSTAGVVIFALTMATIDIGWIFWAYVAGALIGCTGILLGALFLGDFISGKRALAKERTVAEPGTAGKSGGFFKGVGDFIVLVAQIVRVKKWKICPFVEVK